MFTVREKLNVELLFTQISYLTIVSFIHVNSVNFCEDGLCATVFQVPLTFVPIDSPLLHICHNPVIQPWTRTAHVLVSVF